MAQYVKKLVKCSATYANGNKAYAYIPVEQYSDPIEIGKEIYYYKNVPCINHEEIDKMVEEYFNTPLGKLVLSHSRYRDKLELKNCIIEMSLKDDNSSLAYYKQELDYIFKIEGICDQVINYQLY